MINALCDIHHPCQALADLLTIYDFTPAGTPNKEINVCFVGDGNNVSTSLMQICALTGINFRLSCPPSFDIPLEQWKLGVGLGANSGARLEMNPNPIEAVKSADIIYSDTFISKGQEAEREARLKSFEGYQVNAELMGLAKSSAKFMHCLPAHRGEEVTDEIMDSARSIVFDQAENRLHIAKALLSLMCAKPK